VVCGHSHCGAIKGLLKLNELKEDLPLMYNWLKHTETTRRLVNENYSHLEGEELLEIAVAENVLTQIENLKTYPVIHSRLYQGKLKIYGWIYHFETGEVMAYNPDSYAYVRPQSQVSLDTPGLIPAPIACELPPIKIPRQSLEEDYSRSI
jgi:carbonic anhydrase